MRRGRRQREVRNPLLRALVNGFEMHVHPHPAVLVVGAGVAGMQAALDLAAMNHAVYLVERAATIGGNMARLDKTFPTNDCSTCMISPRMVACARHARIQIFTLAELVDVTGEPGRFAACLRMLPRYVDQARCIGCGLCVEKCPRKVPNAYNAGLDMRKAIHFAHSQAIPLVPVIDTDACIYFQKGRCRACEKVCPTQAVRLGDATVETNLAVGAVVLATGYELALVPQAGEYGYQRYPNVVTAMDFERMLAATGPHGGHPRRPSDGRQPGRIAWLQCVGSRDSARERNFCSSVCCMAAVKQALLTREHYPESEAALFYLDIRAQGKDFDRYVLRAADQYGVRFVHSMLSQVIQDPVTHNLILNYYDRKSLEHVDEEFDLVVLSPGMKPDSHSRALLQRLDLECNRHGFAVTDGEGPALSSRSGIFVCGMLDGPKDIPESVTGASAAAAGAAALLRRVVAAGGVRQGDGVRGDEHDAEASPGAATAPAREASTGTPRVGVFVCHCGHNIAGVIDVDALRDFAVTLPHVVLAKDFLFTCSTRTQEELRDLIGDQGLDRVVIAACSPRTHEPLFRETLKQAGLNPYLLEMANIRDQCSWVHGREPQAATAKARRIIQAAAARAVLLEPVDEIVTPVVPAALVIGGGLAGMTAALTLADLALDVVLVEQSGQLGGMAREILHTLEGAVPRRLAERLALRVYSHRRISVFHNAALEELGGGPGHFHCRVGENGATHALDVGAVIVATGGVPHRPTDFCYGQHEGILTQLELEKRLFGAAMAAPRVTAMIQCVGSRSREFPLCSRICCAAAVKNSLRLMALNPNATIYVFYRDIRTYGFKEEYYRQARDIGVVFVKYDAREPPEVSVEDGNIRVTAFDAGSQLRLELAPDLLVLSAGIRPRADAAEIARKLKLPTIPEGFFLEAHPKLAPLDTSSSGIFLCGLAHSPRFIEESLAQAKGAAGRAAGLLLQRELRASGVVAVVDRMACSSCLKCVRACPYRVPVMDEEGISVIDPHGCQGCGICVAECPAKAIVLRHYTDGQLNAQAACDFTL